MTIRLGHASYMPVYHAPKSGQASQLMELSDFQEVLLKPSSPDGMIPYKQIRAVFNERTVRVYQAFPDAIADKALSRGNFLDSPFKMDRMTWIKPSFLWMMYRSGWGEKSGQERVLAIDLSHEGFAWALRHACLSRPAPDTSKEAWQHVKQTHPVRIQWDPERDLHHNPLSFRSLQVGLSGEAVEQYNQSWIQNITDVTGDARRIESLVKDNRLAEAVTSLPAENPYPIPDLLALHIGASM